MMVFIHGIIYIYIYIYNIDCSIGAKVIISFLQKKTKYIYIYYEYCEANTK